MRRGKTGVYVPGMPAEHARLKGDFERDLLELEKLLGIRKWDEAQARITGHTQRNPLQLND